MLDGVVVTLERPDASNLADNTELYEMSKDEGDEAGLLTIEAETGQADRNRREAWNSAACSTTRPTRCTASWTSRPAPVAPRPATGPACCCAST